MSFFPLYLILSAFGGSVAFGLSFLNKRLGSYILCASLLAGSIWGFFLVTSLEDSIIINLSQGGGFLSYSLAVTPIVLTASVFIYTIAFLLSLSLIRRRIRFEYFFIYGVIIFACNSMLFLADLFSIFVMIQIFAIGVMLLSLFQNFRAGSRGGYKYCINAGLIFVIMLGAIALIYSSLGTLNIASLSTAPSLNKFFGFLVGAGVLIGLFFKTALFPFNAWVPDLYRGVRSHLSATLASLSTLVGVILIARIVFTAMHPESAFGYAFNSINFLMFSVSIVSVFVGEFAALNSPDIKKMLAYSTVGQLGLIVLAVALAMNLIDKPVSQPVLFAALFLLIVHSIAKPMMYLIAGFFIKSSGKSRWDEMRGIGFAYPFLAGAFIIGGFALMGVPLFAGFWGKFGLIYYLFDGDNIAKLGLIIVIFTSIIEGVYFMRAGHSFFEKGDTEFIRKPVLNYWLIVFSIGVMLSVLIIIGIFPAPFSEMLNRFALEVFDFSAYTELILSGGGL
jgi:formate hydrogenlyase subunit 3/multisubunit Na+/H+ antiporter MnhD subunit